MGQAESALHTAIGLFQQFFGGHVTMGGVLVNQGI
jgi:hypothetical protein